MSKCLFCLQRSNRFLRNVAKCSSALRHSIYQHKSEWNQCEWHTSEVSTNLIEMWIQSKKNMEFVRENGTNVKNITWKVAKQCSNRAIFFKWWWICTADATFYERFSFEYLYYGEKVLILSNSICDSVWKSCETWPCIYSIAIAFTKSIKMENNLAS